MEQTFRLDSKGRITLGKLAEGVSSFRATRDSEGKITLIPYVEIPAREMWLYQNTKALAAVEEGLRDVAAGRIVSMGSFAKYANVDLDED
jgi:hypothetical protein